WPAAASTSSPPTTPRSELTPCQHSPPDPTRITQRYTTPGDLTEAWDATNYLGGIADVLEQKTNRGAAVEHLRDLADVWLYRNDRQIKRVSYREETRDTAGHGYWVTVSHLPS
uniref:hypothetical protein n=1 Tax=Nocardioides caldifontis TaxID=2588938 RepID=UPI00193974AC